jgi:hypothetical protein
MGQSLKAFISYRRRDAFMRPNEAGEPDYAFIDKLVEALNIAGFDDVFVDRRDIKGGYNFESIIRRRIADCDLFVAVMGGNWLEILRQKQIAGDRDDVVREIWAASRLNEKAIVPLLVDRAVMPRPIELPKQIRRFHLQNGVGINSADSPQTIAATLDEASSFLKRLGKLTSNWANAYIAFAVFAYIACAILPHVVGVLEFGRPAWVGMAKVWSGLYIWPICFLPFVLVALYRPLTTLVESAITASNARDRRTYLTPLVLGTLISILAVVFEVGGPFEVPWSVHPALPGCANASSPATPDFVTLSSYDNPLDAASGSAGPLQARYGERFWMKNKCWPNALYYLTVPVYQGTINPDYLAARPKVQRAFMSVLALDAAPSLSVFPYVLSFFILAWLGCTGIVMSVFYVMVQIRRPNDDDVLRLPSEDAYLCLTYSFVTLIAWLPFRMSTIYFKNLYSCETLGNCPFNPLVYLTDGIMGAMLLIAYVFLTAGLLVKYHRLALSFLGTFAIATILFGAFVVVRYGAEIALFSDYWQFYLGISIPSILVMMALWYFFDPSMSHKDDFDSNEDR